MRKKNQCKFILPFIASLFYFQASTAQPVSYDANQPPDSYRSERNPMYWKNRLPFTGYWQQDVSYKIAANVDEQTDIIEGTESLTYWNNSPDILSFVYFHIYQNAFIKGGYIENLNLNNHFKQTFGKYESAGLGENISSIKSNGSELKTEVDFSVMKVYLMNPLSPGDSTRFDISFKTYYDNGSQRRRMKKFNAYGFTHYDGVHWYPRICVYDRKLGWDTDQHLGKEFYGDFGTYDVQLTFSSNYVVGATGTLQNEGEVLPEELRKKLDILNFARKPWESKPSVITPYDSSQRKTWHFYAENVHDFAWTADPTYRIGETYAVITDPYLHTTRNILCQSLVQEPHAAGWQDAALFTARSIETYSRDFGMYSWPKIIVADARDGMEYPMLTLDGGFTPGYYDVISHEVGHMWFFAQVGNNETYRAALDEGFTQFLETWDLRHITGDTVIENAPRNKYAAHFTHPSLVMDEEAYLGYLADAAKGTDESINQHSDAFNGALNHGGGYRHVYYKTATMLWNLQYALGDSLFQDAMKNYFNQWKFCHPYFEDFRNSIIQFTHVDLNWFFDEWMESTKTIDYNVKSVKHVKDEVYEITFGRRGRSQMPIDFRVGTKDGRSFDFYIPNTWFEKKTTATVLPKWYGWDNLHPTYTCTVTIPSGIDDVIIDPSYRLADVYMADNTKKCDAVWQFDSQVSNLPDWKHYHFNWRPDLWYNAVDGLKLGMHIDGNYFELKNKFSLTAWFNSTLLQNGIADYELKKKTFDSISPVSFNFWYSTNTHRFIRNSTFDISLKYLDGLIGGSAGFAIQVSSKNSISFGIKSMYRAGENDLDYLLYPDQWIAGNWNNTASAGFEHRYQYFNGSGDINFILRSSSLFSDYQYADLTMTAINKNKVAKFTFNTRLAVRVGSGQPAPESAWYLAGESPEEMVDNKFVRSKAFVPSCWLGYGSEINHFQEGGGMNLRGYAGYAATELNEDDGKIYPVYKGMSGASINGELEFDNYIRLRPKISRDWLHIDTYLFADVGSIGYRNDENIFFLSRIRADAGPGIALTIKNWGPLNKVKPLILRADFPLVINRIPFGEDNYFSFRYVIGIGRAF